MNSQPKDLEHYFDAFTRTHRMSEADAWEILDRVTNPADNAPSIDTPPDDKKRRGGMFYFICGMLALLGVTALVVEMPVRDGGSSREAREPVAATARQSRPEQSSQETSRGLTAEREGKPSTSREDRGSRRLWDRPGSVARAFRSSGQEPSPDVSAPAIAQAAGGDSVTVDTIRMNPDTSGRSPTPLIQGPIAMSGVRLLDLTREELIGFGLVPEANGSGVEWFETRRRGGTSYAVVSALGSGFRADSAIPASWPATAITESPILLSRRNGDVRMMDPDETKFAPEEYRIMIDRSATEEQRKQARDAYGRLMHEYLAKLAPTLLPILVRTGRGAEHSPEKDQVLWFIPTPDVIARLPAAIRDHVRREVEAAEKVASGTMTQEQALRSGVTPTLDLVRSASGSIARTRLARKGEAFVLDISLAESRAIRVELFDIEGRRLDQLMPSRDLPFGDHSIEFTSGKSRNGVYLIVVTSDREERAVHRVWLGGSGR